MTRIGPNQDINDPTTIIDLAYRYQQKSNDFGNLLSQYIEQDLNVSGSPIVDVSIPFKITDGSTELLYGSDIIYNDGYIYDTDMVSNATILTYIDLAERFREYWKTLNNIIDQLGNFTAISGATVLPHPYVYTGIVVTSSLGGNSWTEKLCTHTPSSVLPTPIWSGYGPTNYNKNTYQQLLNELNNIDINRTYEEETWDTIYWCEKITQSGSRSTLAEFGISISPFNPYSGYVQFYNSGLVSMDISMSINVDANADGSFGVFTFSVMEIKDRNDFPSGLHGDQSSYEEYDQQFLALTPSESGTLNISIPRTISVPSGKSVFVWGRGIASPIFPGSHPPWPPSYLNANITVTLEGYTITNGV